MEMQKNTNPNNSYDIIIVGAGCIGSVLAFELRNSKLKILLVDPNRKPNGSATLAAGAMLGAFAEITTDKTSELDQDEIKFRLESRQLFPDLLEEIRSETNSPVFHGFGTFIIANVHGGKDAENLDFIEQSAKDLSEPVERAQPSKIPGLSPHPSSVAYGSLFLPNEGFVDTASLINSIHASLNKNANIDLIDDCVFSISQSSGSASGVVLASGQTYAANKVVLCAGARTQPILDQSDLTETGVPRVVWGKGVSLDLSPAASSPHVIRTPNRDFACGLHAVPRANGSIYIGATNRISSTPGSDIGPTAGEVLGLLYGATNELHTGFRTSEIKATRFGSRPLSIDRYPVFGQTQLDGLFVATGTYRNGVVMAPLIAKHLADQILSKQTSNHRNFGPRKCSTSNLPDFGKLVRDGAEDLVSFIQEPDGRLPFDRQRELQAFIELMMTVAIDDQTDMRRKLRDVIVDAPITESIPQLFYMASSLQSKRPAK